MVEAGAARDELLNDMLGDFLDESRGLLARLNENLLTLDTWASALIDDDRSPCDPGLLNEMFRSAHSLKGLSAMLGLSDINMLTHHVENVFDAARHNELMVSPDSVELMFKAVDRLGAMIAALADPAVAGPGCHDLTQEIQALLDVEGAAKSAGGQAEAEQWLGQRGSTPHEATARDGSDAVEPARVATAEPPDYFADLRDEREIPAKYLSIFIDETESSLDEFTETLLSFERGARATAAENLLVTAHRIKGSAASIGLSRAAKLAHLMEDFLQELRERKAPLSPETVDAMLHCADGLRAYVASLRTGQPSAADFNALYHELIAARGGMETPAAPAKKSTAQAATGAKGQDWLTSKLRGALANAAQLGESAVAGVVTFQPGLPLAGLKAQLLYKKLSQLGAVFYCDPPAAKFEERDDLESFTFGVNTDRSAHDVRRMLCIAGVLAVELERFGGKAPAKPAAAVAETSASPATPATSSPAGPSPAAVNRREPAADEKDAQSRGGDVRPAETLRVDIERLDQLMNLAGQLVINKARFARIGEGLRQLTGNSNAGRMLGNVTAALRKISGDECFESDTAATPEARLDALRGQARRMQADLESVLGDVQRIASARAAVNDLLDAVHQLERVSDGIQRSVMDTRMVPIGPLFTRFKRVVRDITRNNGKDVALVIRGEKTELDKRMIDELADPLIHMVRNSADHGIELPADREAAGKPRQGAITLDAFHRGNSIIIQVIDDGRGLDPQRIRDKAIEKSLIGAADADKLSPQQILQLVWEPGFSTAEQVTEISGRGMGMDIVRSKIEQINGTVELSSTPGAGTTLTIKLPLTLAILPSLMTEIDGDVIALPLESVREIVAIPQRDLGTVLGVRTAQVRGRVVSAVRLSELLTWNGASRAAPACDSGDTTLVIISDDTLEVGLVVDRLLGEEDIVIKSLAENYRNLPGVAGASILGDGRVSLILDTSALIEAAAQSSAANVAPKENGT